MAMLLGLECDVTAGDREWTLCLDDYYACVSAWWEDRKGGMGQYTAVQCHCI